MKIQNGGGWNTDLAWGLSLIVLNVVFHALSLGLINKAVTSRLSGSLQHWHHVFLSIYVVGRTALDCHAARHRGFQLGGRLPTSRGIAGPAVCNALFDERYDQLRPRESVFWLRWQMMGALEALNG